MDVPEGVIDLLTDLRNWLQDKAEPPIYVSDRRFMKSVQLLQVAAFADGRDEVTSMCEKKDYRSIMIRFMITMADVDATFNLISVQVGCKACR